MAQLIPQQTHNKRAACLFTHKTWGWGQPFITILHALGQHHTITQDQHFVCVCVCVRACVHNIPQYSFTFAVYLPVLHMCIQIRVWSCKCLFTETAVRKFLRGWAILWPETFLFCPLHVFIHFSASFCRAHCALYFWLGTMHHRNAHYYYY